MDSILPVKPCSYSELQKYSFRLYWAGFAKVILLSIAISIIIFIPRLLSDLVGQDLFLNLPPLSFYRFWLLLINLASIVFFIGILWRLHCTARAVHESFITDIRMGLQKILYAFIATLIQSAIVFAIAMIIYGLQIVLHQHLLLLGTHPLLILLATCIFAAQIILLLYVNTLFIFSIPLIALRHKNVFMAIEQSILLTWNHWWRVFSVQITPWFCYFFLVIVVKFILRINIHLYFFGHHPHTLKSTLINLIVFTFFIPWIAAVLVLQLNDLELRKAIPRVHARKRNRRNKTPALSRS